MIARIIELSIRFRILILIATVLLVSWGIYSIKESPLDAIPDLSDVQVIIKTSFPGQSPKVVEDQVTYPLTTTMLSVSGAVTVRGYSYFGDSYVYVIFKDGTDINWARSRVLEYLNQVSSRLPREAKPSLGPDATGVGWIFQYALVDTSGKHSIAKLRAMQDWDIKYELQTVPGVSEVATIGGMVKQYQVVLDPNRLRAYNLTLKKVRSAIRKANNEVGGSVVEMAEAEYMIRATGYIKSIDDLRTIPLGVNKKGTPITLQDISRIQIGPQMRRGIGELNGKGEAVGGIVVMRYGENALKTIKAVKKKIREVIQPSLPDGAKLVTTYDRSGLIHNSVKTLTFKLILELIIVAVVCIVFLYHFRSALVIIISLPIGVLVAFIIMKYQGINANIMSLGGIAIAIGAMVDASIVLIENLHKTFENEKVTNENRWRLVFEATKDVGGPLFISLLIIMLSFIPVFVLEYQEGRLFSPLAFTKTYAMAAAAGLSVTLVPVLMGYLIRGNIASENSNPINRFLVRLYKPFLHLAVANPIGVIVIALIITASMIIPYSNIGNEFMPEIDEGDIMYMPTTFPGISIGKAKQLLQQTDKLIMQVPEVKRVYGKIGRSDSATDPAPLTMIETTILLKPKSEWRRGMTKKKIKDELDAIVKFPGLTNAWIEPIKTRIDMLATGIKTPIGVKIAGPSLEVIQEIGQDIEKALKGIKGTQSVYAQRVVGGRYVKVDIKRNAASRYGLNISDIHEVVRTAVGGMNITESVEGRKRFPVNIRYPRHYRDSLTKLRHLPIVTPSGAHILLKDVATVDTEDGPAMIKSENAKPNGWVFVDIKDRDLGGYVEEAKKVVRENVKKRPGYTITFSGQYEYLERAKGKLAVAFVVSGVIILLLLYFTFFRFLDVAIIATTISLALAGGFWFLFWLNYNMSVAVMVGFIALGGVAVEIGVVMLVYLNLSLKRYMRKAEQQQRDFTQEDLHSAVMEGALLRIRPIMMTVATIIAGLLPIMIGGGTGSEVMKRIAAPMVGGMISATLLTLIVIPAVFYMAQSQLRFSRQVV